MSSYVERTITAFERLETENAELRKSLEFANNECEKTSIEFLNLQAENAKLREFAAETWELLTCNEPVFVWKGLREKARELGVEDTDG